MSHGALPHWLARVNVRFSNRFMRPIAARLPWFVVLEHVGRTSGTVRRTALMAFHRQPDNWVIALTYGADVQWLRNVLAAGGCRLLTRGRWIDVGEPHRFHDATRSRVPWTSASRWPFCGSMSSWSCARAPESSASRAAARCDPFAHQSGLE